MNCVAGCFELGTLLSEGCRGVVAWVADRIGGIRR